MPDAPAWSDDLLSDPHARADKQRRVRDMFAAIAPSYDLNNRLHSFGRDQAWRRAAVKLADLKWDDRVIDVACGTGDLSIAFGEELVRLTLLHLRTASEYSEQTANDVLGIDFTFEMLPLAAQKTPTRRWTFRERPTATTQGGLSITAREPLAKYINGDAQDLPLPDACCDVVSIAFGIRNVQDVAAALREFYRVLRPGGRVIVLEFSEPTNPLLRAMNRFYTRRVMPLTATWISRDKSGAYRYLPKSVETFLSREQMTKHLADAGFVSLVQRPMTFGVCVAYRGEKP